LRVAVIMKEYSLADYWQVNGTVAGLKLYVRDHTGQERLCSIVKADDTRKVRIGAKVRIHYEGLGSDLDEELAHDSDRIKAVFAENDAVTYLKKEFYMLDQDGNGSLSLREIQPLLVKLIEAKSPSNKTKAGQNRKQLEIIFRQLDTSGDGMVSSEEFITWVVSGKPVAKKKKPVAEDKGTTEDTGASSVDAHAEKSIIESFKRFDANGDGVISRDELRAALAKIDPALSKNTKAMDALLNAADRNGDGSVDYKEFVTWIIHGVLPPKLSSTVSGKTDSAQKTDSGAPKEANKLASPSAGKGQVADGLDEEARQRLLAHQKSLWG